MASTPKEFFDDMWDERSSSPDFPYDTDEGEEMPDYDGMSDKDEY